MKSNLIKFIKNKTNVVVIPTSIFINLLVWIFIFFYIKPSEYPIPLHYSIYFGIDFIDYWYKIYIIPASGIFVIVINIFLSYLLFNKERIVSYFISYASLATQILLFVAAYAVTMI